MGIWWGHRTSETLAIVDYTLPVLVTDPSTNAAIGDSFDIATFLLEKFPGAGAGNLFPEQKLDYELPGAF